MTGQTTSVLVANKASTVVVNAPMQRGAVSSGGSSVVISSNPDLAVIKSGTQGQKGEKGDPGTGSATALENFTGTTIGGHRMVAVDPLTGGMVLADCMNASHADLTIGMTEGAVENGASGSVILAGEIEEPSWNLAIGASLWLGSNGMLVIYSALPSSRLFDRHFAVAISQTKIVLNNEPPFMKG